ncbi:hypothetical protein JCM12294_44640 [Desulfocicer niacini]
MNIREVIAERLSYEFSRRNIPLDDIAQKVKLSKKKVIKYFEGKSEIRIPDITAICKIMGVNPVRLIYTREYPKPKLSFRNADFDVQRLASQIEDSFISICHAYPEIKPNVLDKFKRNIKDSRSDAVMIAAANAAEIVRKKYSTPEKFISHYNIPVIPIKAASNGFDGFLISLGDHHAICVNENKPPQRIRFTLCHEISHLLFDRHLDLPIDIFLLNLYRENYTPEEIPEFFAYKFAQFYLLPFDALQKYILQKWPNLDDDKMQRLIDIRGASVDVFINVVFDIIKLGDGIKKKYEKTTFQYPSSDYQGNKDQNSQFDRMDYQENREDLWGDNRPWYEKESLPQKTTRSHIKQYCSAFKSSNRAKNIYSFLNHCRQQNSAILATIQDDYSEDVLNFITRKLQFGE